MKKTTQSLSTLLYALAASCGAQTLPNGLFTIGDFEIGKATISDVQAYFGPSELHPLELGDGADSGVCYSNISDASSSSIFFETGALGGWTQIIAYRITKNPKRKCQLTNISIEKLSTKNGLKLLSGKRVAMLAINFPSSKSFITTRVKQIYKRKATDEEVARLIKDYPDQTNFAYDVVDTIEVRFKNNLVHDLYVKRLVSY